MTISLVRHRFNLVILILFYGLAATSDLNPALAGKKVTALGAIQEDERERKRLEHAVKAHRVTPDSVSEEKKPRRQQR